MKYKKVGYTIEIELPQDKYKGFIAECTYHYSKKHQRYALSMWLKNVAKKERY